MSGARRLGLRAEKRPFGACLTMAAPARVIRRAVRDRLDHEVVSGAWDESGPPPTGTPAGRFSTRRLRAPMMGVVVKPLGFSFTSRHTFTEAAGARPSPELRARGGGRSRAVTSPVASRASHNPSLAASTGGRRLALTLLLSVSVRLAPSTRDCVREAWERAPPSARRFSSAESARVTGARTSWCATRGRRSLLRLSRRRFQHRAFRHDAVVDIPPQRHE